MEIWYFNDAEVVVAYIVSASFYISILLTAIAFIISFLAVSLYKDKANKVGFGKLLRKVTIFLLDGALMMMIIPIIYILLATILFRSLIENIIIVVTKIFM